VSARIYFASFTNRFVELPDYLSYPVPVIGFAARSGTGKTTLLRKLIRHLSESGFRLGVIKHSHHDFEIDQPGKDSYELHHAGSSQTLLTSSYRSALIRENFTRHEPQLQQALAQLDSSELDLVLVEGFRDDPTLRKIEIYRPSLGRDPLFLHNPGIIAVACDEKLPNCALPILPLDDVQRIASFILNTL
jgi:molybdopterin-guanine dinucleotide biosynthesis protein B